MANLMEALTYGIPGFAQGVIQGKQIMGKDEDREINRKKLAIEERKLKLLEDQQQEALRQKIAQHQAIQAVTRELEGGQPTAVAPTDVSDLATGGVPMQPKGGGGMQIPGRAPDPRRMLQQAIQGGLIEKEEVGRFLGLGKPGEEFMASPYGPVNLRTGQPLLPIPSQQGPPSTPAQPGFTWLEGRDALGRPTYRQAAAPGEKPPQPPGVYAAGRELGFADDMRKWTQDQWQQANQRMTEIEGKKTGERAKGGIQAKFEMMGQLAEIRKAEELAKRDPAVIQRDLQKSDAMQSILVKHAGEKAKVGAEGRLKGELTVDPDTGMSLAQLTEIQRNKGRPVPAELSQQLHLYRSTLDTVDRVRKEFTEDEIFKFAGIWNRGEKYVAQAVKQDPKFFKFLVLNEQLRSTAFQYGGKQLTPFEASVVFGFTPTGRELWAGLWVEKMNELETYTQNRLNQLETLVNQPRGAVTPTPLPPQQPGWTPRPNAGPAPAPGGAAGPRIRSIVPVR